MSVLLYAAIIIVVLLVVILWAVLPALKKERLLRFAADRDRLQILQEMASRNDEYDKGTLEEIVLVEIKVGKSQLTTRERQVRDAIQQSRVSWQILRLENGTV